jgi:4-alpha-glucanotransferase
MTLSAIPRSAGILLHPTSLPGRHGIGDLGAGARAFVDFLRRAGLSLWQVLPLVPAGPGGSPYSSSSALAGNELLIDLEELVRLGLLTADDVRCPESDPDAVDVFLVNEMKRTALQKAARALASQPGHELHEERRKFIGVNPWVCDYALFVALKQHRGGAAFWDWERALRDREEPALEEARRALKDDIDDVIALQVIFDKQWRALKALANEADIRIVGDVPLYVDADSCDVWVHRESFQTDETGRPAALSGAPPDFFSALGQLWGNPIYDWAHLATTGHQFWVERMRRMLLQCDIVRIDHFRGLSRYWEVAPGASDARGGRWVKGPGARLFEDLEAALGPLPLIAEDLGVIDDQVRELKEKLALPGMHILQFAFGDDILNPYLPHRHEELSAVYTGTHDNNTTLGWWEEQPAHVQEHVCRYLHTDGSDVVWDMIRSAFSSVARLAIIPMQDALRLGGDARMNVPGLADGNWTWRVRAEAFNDDVAARLKYLATLYDRDVLAREHLLKRKQAAQTKAAEA